MLAGALAGGATARADARGVLRIGVLPLALEPDADTPLIGGYVDDAVSAYNSAAASYNHVHGYRAGTAMASAPIDRSALAMHATLVTFAPGLELGGDNAVFRLEAQLGISDQVHAFGVGVYPLDLAIPLRNGSVTPYVAAGGTASWLSRTDTDGGVGGLVTVRAAVGVRLGRRVVLELGYGMYVLGGLYDGAKLSSMSHYDPRGAAPPPQPSQALAGGQQSNLFDVSLGFVM